MDSSLHYVRCYFINLFKVSIEVCENENRVVVDLHVLTLINEILVGIMFIVICIAAAMFIQFDLVQKDVITTPDDSSYVIRTGMMLDNDNSTQFVQNKKPIIVYVQVLPETTKLMLVGKHLIIFMIQV
jgi:hypothetical protein